MKRKAMIYGLAVVVFLLGMLLGTLVNAANATTTQYQVLWQKECEGRVVVHRGMMVRCVASNDSIITPTYRPTPSPAPTETP